MNTNTVISRKHIMLTILFAVYMSEYMLCLICMDQSAYALSDTGYDLHYLRMPAVAAGFLLHGRNDCYYGFLGGAVYYYFAMGFVMHPYLGRLSGIGGAAAFLIQMSVQYLIPANPAMLVLLVAGFAFTAYITLFSKERYEWMFDEPLEFRDPCCCLFILFGGCKAHILPVIIEGRRPTTALRSMAENTKVHDNT